MGVIYVMFVPEFLYIVLETFTCIYAWISFIDLANPNVSNSNIHIKYNTPIANKIEVFNAACSLLLAADTAD